ncbi:MAG TPA: EamA family transporter [Syntrophales bacterium]|nr:EamA family transporter [Syntrophales bacterium]HRT62630.1 EamA family transporter [Syntrophales bacterium]
MNRRLSGLWRPVAALILLAVIWGYNWVVMKQSLQFMGPFDFNALRMALGGVILLFFMLVSGMSLRPRQMFLTILLGLSQTAAGTGLILWALVDGGAGKTVILVYTMPFWILLFAWPVLSEKIRGLNWLPVLSAFAGMVLLLEPWVLKSTVFSEVMAVIAGVCWAVGAIIIKLMQKKPGFDPVSATAWQFVYGSIPLIAVALLVPEKPADWNPYLITAVIYNAVLVCAFAFLLWTYIMKKLPAGVAGMGTLAVPVIGIAGSMLELGERPDTWEASGMGLILAALFLLALLKNRENRRNGLPMSPE